MDKFLRKSAEILPGRSLWHDIPAGLLGQRDITNEFELFPSVSRFRSTRCRALMKATWTCENAWQRWVVVAEHVRLNSTDTVRILILRRFQRVEQTSGVYQKSTEVTLQLPVCCSQEFLGWWEAVSEWNRVNLRAQSWHPHASAPATRWIFVVRLKSSRTPKSLQFEKWLSHVERICRKFKVAKSYTFEHVHNESHLSQMYSQFFATLRS